MSRIDPCAPNFESVVLDVELTLEDVVQMELYQAETTPSPGPAAAEPGTATTAAAPPAPGVLATESPRPALLKRSVSGRYRSPRQDWQLELRVDVDGLRPMRRLSGDFYQVTGATVSYFGSFVVDAVTLMVSNTRVVISGPARTTWPTSHANIQVTIPRRLYLMAPARASVQWTSATGQMGSSFTCVYESRYFRTIDLEQDQEQPVTPFVSYDTSSLLSGGPPRALTIAKAYAEAGIEIRSAGVTNVVPPSQDSTWSNAELHDAMLSHFDLWQDLPQWKVWLLHASCHDSPITAGIMFDQQGQQRQGAAVFYHNVADATPEAQRVQLYVGVHELGHCFNLYHAFQKQFTNPPSPQRPDALSWMNYPQYYPAGQQAFWNAFPFAFDDLEILHLRHAFRSDIIMGGNPFGLGAALQDPAAFVDPVENNAGLRLELEAPSSFAFGEPVVVEVKLYLTVQPAKQIPELHPKFGFVQIAVQKPSGAVVVYKPLIEHCATLSTSYLDESRPSAYESAYIGYDLEQGQLFDQPGLYKLRGIYYGMDGSIVLSQLLPVRVRPPVTPSDEKVADLFLGDQQGALLFLLGSDSDHLAKGREAFEQVLDQFGEHPLAVYAQLVKGMNAAREFKTLGTDGQIEVREPQPEEAIPLLSAVVDASKAQEGVDNITLNMTLQQMARAQMDAGDEKGARATINEMGEIFRKKKLKPHVEALIKEQQAALRAEL